VTILEIQFQPQPQPVYCSNAIAGGRKVEDPFYHLFVTILIILHSRERWQITIAKHALSLTDLKKSLRSDGQESPCKAGLRSVCWKASIHSVSFFFFSFSQMNRQLTHYHRLSSCSRTPTSPDGQKCCKILEVHTSLSKIIF